MPVPSAITDLSTTLASNSPAGSDNVFPDLDNYLRAHAQFVALLRDGRGLSTEVSLASAATCDIGGAASMFVQVTGTTTITSFGTNYLPRILRFAGVLTLTHNATTLILPTGANITTAAGDMCLVVPVGTSGWRVLQYQRASEGADFVSFLQSGTGASSRTVQSKLRDVVSVKDFGAVGDGVTDDTTAFANALAALGTGVRLSLSGLTIKISQQNIISSKSNFEIDGEGGTIIAANGMTVASDKELLSFRSCTDFTIKNLTVNGNRANRTPAEVAAHNIEIRSCQRFVFERVRSINSVVDGFILNTSTATNASTFVRYGYFLECTADNCYRQGMSIINAYDVVVSGGAFTNTNGTSPQAGIDVEANAGAATPGNAYILIEGASFSGNTGPGVITSAVSSAVDVRIVGCSFSANAERAILAAANNTVIDKCSFRDHTTGTQGLVTFPSSSPAVTAGVIRECTFGNNTAAVPCIYTHSSSSGVRIVGNTIFDHANSGGISLAGTNHTVAANVIRSCGGVGITNSGVECVITQNTISATANRGIYQVSGGANRSKIVDNVVKDITSIVGGYIQSDDSGTVIRGNVCASTSAATTTIGVYLGASSTGQIVCENIFYNLHSTQPIGFSGNATYNHTIHSNIGGTANEARTLLSGMGVPTYTTGLRPAANAVAVGQCIFNTTTLKPNWSNGTNWYNADGTTA